MAVIGISGSYGGLNLGDEAILASAVTQLRAHLPDVEIVVFSRDAEHTRQHHDVDRVLCPRTALRDEIFPEVARLDLLLLGGGGILYDTEARCYLREVMIAHQVGVPTFAFAIGVGPLENVEERRAVRDGLNRMAGITVREIGAKRLLEEIGVDVPITVTADPAFLLDPEPIEPDSLRASGIPAHEPLVGMSVRERGAAAPDLGREAHRLVADTADFVIRRYNARVVFIPMERADLQEAHTAIGLMAAPQCAHVLDLKYTPRQVLGLMRTFEMAVGMRLHFLIFAAVSNIPLLALPYASKVSDLMGSLGTDQRSVLCDESAGTFLADLDRLWDHRIEHKEALREHIQNLQDMARRTVPLAIELIGRKQDNALANRMVNPPGGPTEGASIARS